MTVATRAETVVVPDVHGIKEKKAIEQLEAAGLTPGGRSSAADQLPEGYVTSTDPRAGVSMTRGSLVDYVVSTGPGSEATPRPTDAPTQAPTTSPTPRPTPDPSAPSPFPSQEVTLVGDFLCLDLATARAHIEEAELLVGALYPDEPPPEDSWIVHDQLPKPGESVPIGSNVDLVLMDPLEPCPAG